MSVSDSQLQNSMLFTPPATKLPLRLKLSLLPAKPPLESNSEQYFASNLFKTPPRSIKTQLQPSMNTISKRKPDSCPLDAPIKKIKLILKAGSETPLSKSHVSSTVSHTQSNEAPQKQARIRIKKTLGVPKTRKNSSTKTWPIPGRSTKEKAHEMVKYCIQHNPTLTRDFEISACNQVFLMIFIVFS